jgi:hypothetical protein
MVIYDLGLADGAAEFDFGSGKGTPLTLRRLMNSSTDVRTSRSSSSLE